MIFVGGFRKFATGSFCVERLNCMVGRFKHGRRYILQPIYFSEFDRVAIKPVASALSTL
jgi:hypothetical protein